MRKILGYTVGVMCILGGILYASQGIYFWGLLWILIGGLVVHDTRQ